MKRKTNLETLVKSFINEIESRRVGDQSFGMFDGYEDFRNGKVLAVWPALSILVSEAMTLLKVKDTKCKSS